MEFRIADTFTASLGKLTNQEQKAVKQTAFDLQVNPAHPGMQFHRIDGARDKNFWSIRVNRDIRLIVHKSASSLLLCYVDHHDAAYQWAERRKLEKHPKTGAAQLVTIRETVREIPIYVEVKQPAPVAPPVLAHVSEETLLDYGVPEEWLVDVVQANEDAILDIADHLPAEAAEAVLTLATGGTPPLPVTAGDGADPFEHPDAQRRFRVMHDMEELERALDAPWEKWAVFLHPVQRQYVENTYNGPARVSGSAGTGKTVVALHRAVHLARLHPDARVLLTTFSQTLARALHTKLRYLISNQPRLAERIDVMSMREVGERLYKASLGVFTLTTAEDERAALLKAASHVPNHGFSERFLLAEWHNVVDAWQLTMWDAYRSVRRLGRKTRLPENKRRVLWKIYETARELLQEKGRITEAEMFTQLAAVVAERAYPPYTFAVVDEAQDISVPKLRFLAALGHHRPDSLFFAGDLGQRIFQAPFSWKELGVDVRGRSRTLRINYRTSHQIRMQADQLLGPSITDVDGNVEDRKGTISVFNGPTPEIVVEASEYDEMVQVAEWLTARHDEGVLPHEMGVFVRSAAEQNRAKNAIERAGLTANVLDEHIEILTHQVSLCTMHLAKGLEFRAVVVMACDEDVIPLEERIATADDESDLEEILNTERHLLYVACTRARDHLLVSATDPCSEYLDDLVGY